MEVIFILSSFFPFWFGQLSISLKLKRNVLRWSSIGGQNVKEQVSTRDLFFKSLDLGVIQSSATNFQKSKIYKGIAEAEDWSAKN